MMGKTILVVDDSKTIRRVVELTFHGSEFAVVQAADGQEGLERAHQLRPDLVLADCQMPGKSGYELAAALKASPSTQHIPVVLLAGGFEPFDQGRARIAGASGHIQKPFDTQALISLVKELTGVQVDSDVPLSFAAALARRQAAQQPPAPTPPAPPADAPPVAAQRAPSNPPARAPSSSRPSATLPSWAAPVRAPSQAPAARSPEPRLPEPVEPPSVPAAAPEPPPWQRQTPPATTSPFGAPREELVDDVEEVEEIEELVEVEAVSLDIEIQETPSLLETAEPPPAPPEATAQAAAWAEEDLAEGEEEAALANSAAGPSLEPPPPPGAGRAPVNLDVWALADGAPNGGVIEEISIEDIPIEDPEPVDEEAPILEAPEDAFAPLDEAEPLEIEPVAAWSQVAREADRSTLDLRPETAGVVEPPPAAAPAAAQLAEQVATRLADQVAEPVAAALEPRVPGLSKAELLQVAREVIEQVAWEVVPDLAEVIIKAELERLLRDQD